MDVRVVSDRFYDMIPVFDRFSEIANPGFYHPLPDGWHVGMADVVQSTLAIRANRYKTVNMAGAAVIAAVTNALAGRDFPFVFGGDGASFAVPPDAVVAAREALAATATWVGEQLDLTLRVTLMPVGAIRAQGRDVLVARFGPSKNVSYAMFAGGGIAWAETAMKRGEFAVPHAAPGSIPDLNGLSCRFSEIPARRGLILSLVAVPAEDGSSESFRTLIRDITELVERSPGASRPVPDGGPPFRWPPNGLDLEARTWRSALPLALRRLYLLLFTGIGYFVLNYRIPVGKFSPRVYLRQLVDNSDFRKYDDALRMVLDCTPALATSLEQLLANAAAAGVVRYGLHRQSAAVMTCFTPVIYRSDHVHFIDGADGGYARAATALKQPAATLAAPAG